MKRLRYNSQIDENRSPLKISKLNEFQLEDFLIDGELNFYWIDIYEDNKGKIHLFGKIYQRLKSQYKNCVLTVDGMMRTLYISPKEEDEDYIKKVVEEVNEKRKKDRIQATKLIPFKVKMVERQYNFNNKDITRGKSNFLKIEYPYYLPSFNKESFIRSDTYNYVSGMNTSAIESFIIHHNIMGPCWLNIKVESIFNNSTSKYKKTSCFAELNTNSPKNIKINRVQKPPPPLIVLSIKLLLKYDKLNKQLTIIAISCIVHNRINIDEDTPIENEEYYNNFIIINLMNYKSLKEEESNETIKLLDRINVKNEHALLATFLKKIEEIDPDVIVGHDIDHDIRVISNRIKACHIYDSFIGRYKEDDSKIKMIGRLKCDTLLSIKEVYKSKDYDLVSLSKKVFNIDIAEIEILYSYEPSYELLTNLCISLYQNTLTIIKLMIKFNILPLTKYLTTTCGNVWRRSLTNARAERIEYLLMHKFYNVKPRFIIPDKVEYSKKSNKESKYKGGLVLEPIAGLYDNIILLFDFKSLYPSIIREFDICFTKISILPDIVKELLDSRTLIKILIENTIDKGKKSNHEIKQLAIKLVCNSIYGCLGFQNSRFFNLEMAQSITDNGRKILEQTKNVIKNELKLVPIYGDTDSIMIDTGINDLDKTNKIVDLVLNKINSSYKYIELELDEKYNRLLLMQQKKKYAARLIRNNNIEIKGIDLVRRDWCELSCDICQSLINLIFSNFSKMQIISKIKNFINNEYEKINETEIPLNKFIIRESISKNIEEYANIDNFAHVTIAKRLNNNGILIKPGQSIDYIICNTNKLKASKSEKAFTLKEYNELKKSVDKKWYLEHQIIPPVSRILDALNITNDVNKNIKMEIKNEIKSLTLKNEKRFESCDKLKIKCYNCNQYQLFNGWTPILCTTDQCKTKLDEDIIKTAVISQLDNLLKKSNESDDKILIQLHYLKSFFENTQDPWFISVFDIISKEIDKFEYNFIDNCIFNLCI